jgi:hypothetical protein
MRFLRVVTGCIRENRIRNESIRDELQIYSKKDKLDRTGLKWRENIVRMEADRLPKVIISYKPRGRRLQGRPRKSRFPLMPEQAMA